MRVIYEPEVATHTYTHLLGYIHTYVQWWQKPRQERKKNPQRNFYLHSFYFHVRQAVSSYTMYDKYFPSKVALLAATVAFSGINVLEIRFDKTFFIQLKS